MTLVSVLGLPSEVLQLYFLGVNLARELGGYGWSGQYTIVIGDTNKTYYFSPWKLFDIKLSFVPKEKNEVLLVVVMLQCYWVNRAMTSHCVQLSPQCNL
jgi:hypothetical protein